MDLVFESGDLNGSPLSAERRTFLGISYDEMRQAVYLITDDDSSLYVLPMLSKDYEAFAQDIFALASRALMFPSLTVSLSGGPVFRIKKNRASEVSLKDRPPCRYILKRVLPDEG